MSEKKHAVYGPSSADRWTNCEGSIQLIAKAPPKPPNKWGDEGTQAHDVLDYLIKNRHKAEAARKFLLKDNPAEMVQNAEWALNIIEDIQAELKGSEIFSEQESRFDFIEPGQFGSLDAAIVQVGGTLCVVDYKYGRHEVDVEENLQTILYALGMAEKYKWNFKKIRLVILQPRGKGETYKTAVLFMTELKSYIPMFKKAIARTKAKKPPLNKGPWCHWCPAAVICPEVSTKSLAQVGLEFDDVTKDISLPHVKEFAIPRLGEILAASELLEFWFAEVRAYALNLLQSGQEIPGFKLVNKRATRKWNNPALVANLAKKKFGQEKAFSIDLLSPNQLEQSTKDKDFVKKYSTAVSSGQDIAPESDPRPAVGGAVANEFDDERQKK